MLNELNANDDLMTRLEFHADQSAKRRKLLFVDPFEVDDTNDGIEKLTIVAPSGSAAPFSRLDAVSTLVPSCSQPRLSVTS